MSPAIKFSGTFAVVLLFVGCESNPSSTPSAKTNFGEAKEKIGAAAHSSMDAAEAKRHEYALEIEKAFENLDAKYEELKASAVTAEGQAKDEIEAKLAEAKPKREAAAKKLDELKHASADRWEKVKDGVGNAIDDLKKVFE